MILCTFHSCKIFFIELIFLIWGVTSSLFSADSNDVVINEIAWMGTKASANDEWIELYNNTDHAIDLTGWTLLSADGTPAINLSGMVLAHGYFLLERTDDNTVSDIPADQIYTGAMENNGETLHLKDETGQIIDEVNCSEGWFAGTNSDTLKATMERINPQSDGSNSESWATNDQEIRNGKDVDNNPLNGTPKAQNSVYDSSLPVILSSFSASYSSGTVVLHWLTESEAEIQGFHILRSRKWEGPFHRITTALIPAQGNGSAGKEYEFVDWNVESGKGYWYKIEVVNANGENHLIGPVYAKPRESILPDKYRLFCNYPNPFNPKTTIRYRVSKEASLNPISLKIYNSLGEKVSTLVNEIQSPGEYSVDWNGRDSNGVEVPSGVYFYQLSSGNEIIETKKMLKVK